MSALRFDLGLSPEDERAIREARRRPITIDAEAALRLIRDVSRLVDAAVRRRPTLRGAPFVLPGREHDAERS